MVRWDHPCRVGMRGAQGDGNSRGSATLPSASSPTRSTMLPAPHISNRSLVAQNQLLTSIFKA